MKVTQKFKKYIVESLDFTKKTCDLDLSNGFVIKLQLNRLPQKGESFEVLNVPELLTVFAKGYDKNKDKISFYEKSEGYFVYANDDGYSPVLKVRIYFSTQFHPEWKHLEIGIPLNLTNAVDLPVYIHYDGLCLRVIANGEEVNNEMPFGEINAKNCVLNTNKEVVKTCEVCENGKIQVEIQQEEVDEEMRLYSPRGYNTWAGDVVNFYHDGTYHLMYFIDRHHHGSRFGCGGHAMHHLTTTDFVNWTDHGLLFEFTKQWQSMGTGMMFFANGKYYYTFGYHTERVYPNEKLASSKIYENYNQTGALKGLSYVEIEKLGLFPDGAHYAYSVDGINFTHGDFQFHTAENPSVYPQEDGSFVLYGGYGGEGTWVADSLNGEWKLVDKSFPPCYGNSALKNSSECPSFFEKNGYKYLLIGCSGFFKTEKNKNEFKDTAIYGDDVYDGLFVPMVTKIKGDRLILSGWLGGLNWGSFIVHREIVQQEDGRLAMRWLKEHEPDTKKLNLVAKNCNIVNGYGVDFAKKRSYYIECECEGSGAVSFVFKDNNQPFRLYINRENRDIEVKKIAVGEELNASVIAPTYELITQAENYNEVGCCHQIDSPHFHYRSTDFCIKNFTQKGNVFTVKIMLHYCEKTASTVIDAQINEERTIISNRVDFIADRVEFYAENITVKSAEVYYLIK